VAAVVMALLIYFRNLIGPLLLAFILAFLIQPLALRMTRSGRLSWRGAINIVYLVLLVLVLSSFTAAVVAIIQQAQSAVGYVENFVNNLPQTIETLSHQTFTFGPFSFDFTSFDLGAVAQQALDIVRPIVGQAGNLLTSLASSTAGAAGWGLFILLISYFILSESGQWRGELVHIEVPGYTADFQRLVAEMVGTWKAFLRGQFIISTLVVISYYLLLTILGTRLSLVIAFMAGVSAFVPYVGAFVTWTVTAIVAYFQVDNYFGLSSFWYALLVVGCCLLLNQVFDNLVSPRIMGSTLGVHPAGVLVTAIVATDLIGFVGLMLAAPVLATVSVLWRYVTRKMLDLDPWAPVPSRRPPMSPVRWQAMQRWLRQKLK
jgi:predicted PurR-regulated permease PerM